MTNVYKIPDKRSDTLHNDYFRLTPDEKVDLDNAIGLSRSIVESEFARDSYNNGMNCGKSAVQTVFDFHCQLSHALPEALKILKMVYDVSYQVKEVTR
ncbi:MAG: hypothetical protein K0S24_2220 [Sphingobacterium sp.]|nr:hypothetical protein [Sphingobacterium sp.]